MKAAFNKLGPLGTGSVIYGVDLGSGRAAYRTPEQAETLQVLSRALDRVIVDGDIAIQFQPIVDVRECAILGFEALSRGPSDSPLHSPLVLFDVAARLGRLIELERCVVRCILRRFVELGLPGRLFINVTSDTLLAAGDRGDLIRREFSALGLQAGRIVVELTETRPVLDLQALHGAVSTLRSLGFEMALDDLGEGFASLKRWVEMRPNFVKLDRHFVDAIALDPLKQQLVRSVLEMARASGAEVIAEGLEQAGDLEVLRGLGVRLCQGYLIARPQAHPRPGLSPAQFDLLRAPAAGQRSFASGHRGDLPPVAGALAQPSPSVTVELTCAEVLDRFSRDERLYSLPVVDAEARPIGILRSLNVLKRGSERYFRDLFGRSSCRELMDPQPLLFDVSASLRSMSEAVARLDDRHMIDGFIVTEAGRYVGTGRMSDLLKAVSDLQISSARHANPLTQLPGNVPIEAQVQHWLGRGQTFVAVYWDIDHFKPFNDVYGYQAGDAVIQCTARLLVEGSDSGSDFVGHVGGDDFVSLHEGAVCEQRLAAILARFDAEILRLLRPEHVAAGGLRSQDRQGRDCLHPLPSLSAGVLQVQPQEFSGAAQLASVLAELKRVAKQQPGSSYFLDRRRR